LLAELKKDPDFFGVFCFMFSFCLKWLLIRRGELLVRVLLAEQKKSLCFQRLFCFKYFRFEFYFFCMLLIRPGELQVRVLLAEQKKDPDFSGFFILNIFALNFTFLYAVNTPRRIASSSLARGAKERPRFFRGFLFYIFYSTRLMFSIAERLSQKEIHI